MSWDDLTPKELELAEYIKSEMERRGCCSLYGMMLHTDRSEEAVKRTIRKLEDKEAVIPHRTFRGRTLTGFYTIKQ